MRPKRRGLHRPIIPPPSSGGATHAVPPRRSALFARNQRPFVGGQVVQVVYQRVYLVVGGFDLAADDGFILLGAGRRRLFVQRQHSFDQRNDAVVLAAFGRVVEVDRADGESPYILLRTRNPTTTKDIAYAFEEPK